MRFSVRADAGSTLQILPPIFTGRPWLARTRRKSAGPSAPLGRPLLRLSRFQGREVVKERRMHLLGALVGGLGVRDVAVLASA